MSESPEVVGARAREIVARAIAHPARRRPVVVSPMLRAEVPPPRTYAPRPVSAAPSVAWDDPSAGLALVAMLVDIMAAVGGAEGAVNAMGQRRPGVVAFAADDYLAER